MITESLLNFCYSIYSWLINLVPNIPPLMLPQVVFDEISSIYSVISYIFPVEAVIFCFEFILGFYLTKFIVSIIRFVMSIKVPGLS